MEVDKAYSVNNTQFIRTSIRTWSQGYCQIAIVHKLAEPVMLYKSMDSYFIVWYCFGGVLCG